MTTNAAKTNLEPPIFAKNPWNRRVAVTITVTVTITLSIIFKSTMLSGPSIGPSTLIQYPVGIPDKAEASGMAPPKPKAMPNYILTYSSNFPGKSVPNGWIIYHGKPSNDPGAQFGSAHVVVRGGVLKLNTWRGPIYQNRWVTGGLCQCGMPLKYGAYFVRSRITGGGASAVQLLWPASNIWPPELDFNETEGRINYTSSTVHFGSTNQQEHRELNIDMLKWHTWGVIWSPSSILYTVDGAVWATVSNKVAQIPSVPMHLALQQQTWCF